jgi:hypothetical protein
LQLEHKRPGKRAEDLGTMSEADVVRNEAGKEIKVKIPVGYHIKLHTLKVLKGQSISDTVEIALERYFAAHAFPEIAHLQQPRLVAAP